MNIVVLDALTLGEDIDLSVLNAFGKTKVYQLTSVDQVAERTKNADIIVSNKVKLGRNNLSGAENLKLICELATGFDPIDIDFCAQNDIAVSNVRGYSTDCVAQVTVSMVLSLVSRLNDYREFVASGKYSAGDSASVSSPVFHETNGKTWGIIGLGSIGKKVGRVASALGCNVLGYRRAEKDSDFPLSDLDTLLSVSDIVSVHLPLSDETRNLISAEKIEKMKNGAIFVNVARGAVTDEAALANAVKSGKLGGLGIDVFSTEPFREDHPFYEIKDFKNVCLTPHMAWCGCETRKRCLDETVENIKAFLSGEQRNRIV